MQRPASFPFCIVSWALDNQHYECFRLDLAASGGFKELLGSGTIKSLIITTCAAAAIGAVAGSSAYSLYCLRAYRASCLGCKPLVKISQHNVALGDADSHLLGMLTPCACATSYCCVNHTNLTNRSRKALASEVWMVHMLCNSLRVSSETL
jgi:hypothetical protein